MHSHEHHPHEPDHSLLRRIRSISWFNYAIGGAELVAGALTNSSTLTMAGVHDASDGALYNMKHRAAREADPARKLQIRRRGAAALIGVTLGIGSAEIAYDTMHPEHRPEMAAASIAIVAAGVNIAAVGIMHSKRHHHDAHDSWKHIAGVDLPGALITLVVTPLSVKYPELDVAGTAAHMILATAVGATTLHGIEHSH